MIAPVRLPNIKPTISSVMLSFTLQAVRLISRSTKMAPKDAAVTTAQSPTAPVYKFQPKAEPAKISMATPNPAPELIPSTKGPASGFLKNVCICKPLTESVIPAKIAVKAFGNRYSKRIISQDFRLNEFPKNLPTISPKGIWTEPIPRLMKNSRKQRAKPMAKRRGYLGLFFIQSAIKIQGIIWEQLWMKDLDEVLQNQVWTHVPKFEILDSATRAFF